MTSENTSEETVNGEAERDEPTSRRQFLGRAAAVAVGAPALLAACSDQSPVAPRTATAGAAAVGGARASKSGVDPWITVHKKLLSTVGASSNVTVPALEKSDHGFVQRVITRDDRTGTGLATILQRHFKWESGTLEVIVEDGRGKRWPQREVSKQSDLVYAVRDALATNTLADGVLRESLDPGKPVVAVISAAVVQFWNSAVSDYYGNHLQVASCAFCDLFASDIGGFKLITTTRDFSQS